MENWDRRKTLTAAAWSVPIILAGTAAPALANSQERFALWSEERNALSALRILGDDSALVSGDLIVGRPKYVEIISGSGIDGPMTGEISITYESGIPLSISLPSLNIVRGFGVAELEGATIISQEVTQRTLLSIPLLGTPMLQIDETKTTFTIPQSVGPYTSLTLPIEFALTNRTRLAAGLNVLLTFRATLTVKDASGAVIGTVDLDTITVPIGANVL